MTATPKLYILEWVRESTLRTYLYEQGQATSIPFHGDDSLTFSHTDEDYHRYWQDWKGETSYRAQDAIDIVCLYAQADMHTRLQRFAAIAQEEEVHTQKLWKLDVIRHYLEQSGRTVRKTQRNSQGIWRLELANGANLFVYQLNNVPFDDAMEADMADASTKPTGKVRMLTAQDVLRILRADDEERQRRLQSDISRARKRGKQDD